MPTAMSSDLTHAPPLDLRTGVRTSERIRVGLSGILGRRQGPEPRGPDLIIDVPLWGSLKLGVALYSEEQRRRNAAC